jgi:small GTP-binding protein
MVLFNYSTKELTAKVVYYGAGLCGKTTNLQWIHEQLPIKNKGKMLSLATEADRTLFFDFLPIELGTIRGMKTRVQLYTVPGQVFYNATRRMVLKGADCVVFVADSQDAMIEANADAMKNLRENLVANELDPDNIPLVIQYNKRDLPNAASLDELNRALNARGVPFVEASAKKSGKGVEETLKVATQLVFKVLASKYGSTMPRRETPRPFRGRPASDPRFLRPRRRRLQRPRPCHLPRARPPRHRRRRGPPSP